MFCFFACKSVGLHLGLLLHPGLFLEQVSVFLYAGNDPRGAGGVEGLVLWSGTSILTYTDAQPPVMKHFIHTHNQKTLVSFYLQLLLITFLLIVMFSTSLHFFFLDIQPAGTPHSASQGYGPSVPLQDPGYWQYWCKFLHTTLHSQSNEALSSGASQ